MSMLSSENAAEEVKCCLMHIILDIDHTLLVSKINEEIEEIERVAYRPYLKRFLNFLFDNFSSVNIWSAGGKEYVDEIVKKHLSPLLDDTSIGFGFVYSNKNCKKVLKPIHRGFYSSEWTNEMVDIKDMNEEIFQCSNRLNKFNTMIVDDKRITFSRNYGNAIEIKPFCGKEDDDCLVKVAERFFEIKKRGLDFRKWKNRIIYWEKDPSEEFMKVWEEEEEEIKKKGQ
jgi:hypothetical protein